MVPSYLLNEGLTIVSIENEDASDAKRALVTLENAQLLDTHQGSLGMLDCHRVFYTCN